MKPTRTDHQPGGVNSPVAARYVTRSGGVLTVQVHESEGNELEKEQALQVLALQDVGLTA